jgi:hypothetical protein
MKDYIRREIKFLLYIAFIFFLVLIVVPMVGGQKPASSFSEITRDRRMLVFLGLLFAYALVYPVIAFTTIKRYLNGTYSDNQAIFEKAFESLGFIKTIDSKEKIIYRKKSGFTRFVQWGEDKVVIDPTASPVTISGLRKNVTRIDKLIDQYLSKE